MKKQPIFYWDEETRTATCIISDKENVFIGLATAHPDDIDMMNEKTGYQIALWRAEIKYYTHMRDNDIKPRIKSLQKLASEMKYSKHFNSDSYENKMLQKNIRQLEFDLCVIKDLINDTKQELNTYITEKEKFYQRIRANRVKSNIQDKKL